VFPSGDTAFEISKVARAIAHVKKTLLSAMTRPVPSPRKNKVHEYLSWVANKVLMSDNYLHKFFDQTQRYEISGHVRADCAKSDMDQRFRGSDTCEDHGTLPC
jgi:hypothetical protein